MRVIRWAIAKLALLWFGRCRHSGENVAADLLEGDCQNVAVKWCRRCGASKVVAHGFNGPWRTPDPIEFRQ